MGRVHENQLIVASRQLDMLFEHADLVFAVLIEANLTDPKNVGAFEELGDKSQNIAGELEIFGFLGVDAQPAKVWQTELCGSARFVFGQLAKVIKETVSGTAIESCPEGRFAN